MTDEGPLHSVELVCAAGCGYNVALGNAVPSVVRRQRPDECRDCGAPLTSP